MFFTSHLYERRLNFDSFTQGASHHHHEANISISTSVTIRVTPYEDYFLSWGILWLLLLFVTIFGFVQVLQERRILDPHSTADDIEQPSPVADPDSFSTADRIRCIVRSVSSLFLYTNCCCSVSATAFGSCTVSASFVSCADLDYAIVASVLW